MTSDVTATGDGGIVFTWEKGNREVSIAMPADRSIVYYSVRGDGIRDAGVVDGGWKTVERLVEWAEHGGGLVISGLISGETRKVKAASQKIGNRASGKCESYGDPEDGWLCDEPGTHTTCDPIGGIVCERHKCRCSKPLKEA